ncbi:tyrosine--tRNA ligase [Sphingorhabdus sp.]|jgi:tyrosyl-tRNA synthetase|uniref:tyrosine--tRNA ligase n=1 Tax=Sphingorhabdus sp. TaxID=1902408 RepID=UPI0037C78BF8
MTAYKSDLLRLLDARGYIHQATDAPALDALASKEIVPGYIGFDATAPSLHVGNLVSIMLLRRLQQAGHKPVVVMGGGTTRIGDPTGKDEVRKMLTDDTIEANITSIRTAFEKFLTFGDGPTDAVMVNNHDWLGQLGYIELLQQVGTHFTINRMLTFDSVKLRLEREQPMTFLEFNYMILQGYDFRHLSKTMGVRLQMGGSDQWGNIINGMELARRMDGTEVFGLTTPLITKADGSKMGKSVSGAIWLNREQLPDYDYWQFWRNTDDRDVGRFLRLFTDLPLDEIERLESLGGSEINAAKIALANAATELCRGTDAATLAAETARKTFEEGASGGDLPSVDASGEISVIDALVALNFVASKKEARRMIQGGGARVDGDAVTEEEAVITTQAAPVKISAGKKKHGLINFV